MYIKRFGIIDRLFHLFVMVTFLTEATTGFGRLYISTAFGKTICGLFGGYEYCSLVHRLVGVLMISAFLAQGLYLVSRIRLGNLKESIFGPDSLVPTLRDARQLVERVKWSIGLGPPPEMDRWSYWEKFDYWAVFWGMPLLAVTGLMMMYSIETSRFVPGWILNVAGLLHRAEAVLAVSYIFIVHFFVIHFRPSILPMNEAIFSGSMPLEEAKAEKPRWVKRLIAEGNPELKTVNPPGFAFRVAYFVFGYSVLGFGLYLIINGIINVRHVTLH